MPRPHLFLEELMALFKCVFYCGRRVGWKEGRKGVGGELREGLERRWGRVWESRVSGRAGQVTRKKEGEKERKKERRERK